MTLVFSFLCTVKKMYIHRDGSDVLQEDKFGRDTSVKEETQFVAGYTYMCCEQAILKFYKFRPVRALDCASQFFKLSEDRLLVGNILCHVRHDSAVF